MQTAYLYIHLHIYARDGQCVSTLYLDTTKCVQQYHNEKFFHSFATFEAINCIIAVSVVLVSMPVFVPYNEAHYGFSVILTLEFSHALANNIQIHTHIVSSSSF